MKTWGSGKIGKPPADIRLGLAGPGLACPGLAGQLGTLEMVKKVGKPCQNKPFGSKTMPLAAKDED